MNIVVFETETWAQTAWQRMKDNDEVRLLEEYLTSSNANEHADAKMISTDLSRLDAGILEKFENLQLIATRSTGVDNIDLAYCALTELRCAMCRIMPRSRWLSMCSPCSCQSVATYAKPFSAPGRAYFLLTDGKGSTFTVKPLQS